MFSYCFFLQGAPQFYPTYLKIQLSEFLKALNFNKIITLSFLIKKA